MRFRPSETAIRRLVAVLWIAAVIAATMQQGVSFENNNFKIFRAASLHLLNEQDLYAWYPTEHTDQYKYSPSFALLFLPLALLPFALSMLLWNALNAGVLWLAIGAVLPRRPATIARAVVFLDMLGSLQNVQSNALVAGLIVLTFVAYDRGRTLSGTVSAILGMVIKVFPIAGLSFALFHPRKVRVALEVVGALAVVLALPLLVTPWSSLEMQYASWRALESSDALERGHSLMQIVEHLFGQNWPNWPQQLAGTLALLAPAFVRRERWGEARFRLGYLCSLLLYCIVFNHQVESPTFVIAVAGAAIWFASHDTWTTGTWSLFAFFLAGTILASSDAMPHAIQRALFDRYHAKVIPVAVLWVAIQFHLWQRGARQPLSAAKVMS